MGADFPRLGGKFNVASLQNFKYLKIGMILGRGEIEIREGKTGAAL